MNHLKTKLFFSIAVLLLAGCASNNAALSGVKAFIDRGDCSGAENSARQNLSGNIFYGVMAAIAMDCRHDRRAAIEYLKISARAGDKIAAQMLIENGETPPEPTRQVIIQQAPTPQQQQQQATPTFYPDAPVRCTTTKGIGTDRITRCN